MGIRDLCKQLEKAKSGLDQLERMIEVLEDCFLYNKTKILNLNNGIYRICPAIGLTDENNYIEENLKKYPKLLEAVENYGFKIKRIPRIIGYESVRTDTKVGTKFFGLFNKYETKYEQEPIIQGETFEISVCCEEE